MNAKQKLPNGPASARALVIIPTYNEAENLALIVQKVRKSVPEAHILIADDNSPDGTGELAQEWADRDDQVFVLHRAGKQGLGAAYLDAFAWGLQRGYPILVEMDADGSHPADRLSALLEAVESGADLALGSRWVPGGKVRNWPRSREILSRTGNRYTRLLLGLPLGDATGGFRAFKAQTLHRLNLDEVASQGYCFQVDLAWRTHRKGLRIVELPITFTERERGDSKMNGSIVREALWRITLWGVAHRARQIVGQG